MTEQMNFRVSPELRRNFSAVSEKIGISPNEAMRIFMNSFVSYKGFPFEVREIDPCPLCPPNRDWSNPGYKEEVLQAMRDAKAGIGLTKASWDELDKIWDSAKNSSAAKTVKTGHKDGDRINL